MASKVLLATFEDDSGENRWDFDNPTPRKAILGLENEIFTVEHHDISRIFKENDTKSRGYVNVSV